MNTTLLIITLLVGVALLALEVLILPGGVAGTIGVAAIAFGVWQSYVLFGTPVTGRARYVRFVAHPTRGFQFLDEIVVN